MEENKAKRTTDQTDHRRHGGRCRTYPTVGIFLIHPTYYLVRFYRLITEWLDKGKTIIDFLFADYHKAFYLIRHFVLFAVQNLKQMGTRKEAQLLIVNFLKKHHKCVYALFAGGFNSG